MTDPFITLKRIQEIIKDVKNPHHSFSVTLALKHIEMIVDIAVKESEFMTYVSDQEELKRNDELGSRAFVDWINQGCP